MTRIERCTDPKCRSYGKEFVDRGYGYPVCPANKPCLSPRPMNPIYYGQYKVEVKKEPVLHWFGSDSGTACGLKYPHRRNTADIRTQTTCRRCIASLKKAGLW